MVARIARAPLRALLRFRPEPVQRLRVDDPVVRAGWMILTRVLAAEQRALPSPMVAAETGEAPSLCRLPAGSI